VTMLEGFANAATNPSGTPTGATSVRPSPEGSLQSLAKAGQQVSDEVVENVALSGAAAIRRIIGERNELRRERERLAAVNEELRSQIGKIAKVRDHYVQLATELVTQIKLISNTIRDAVQRTHCVSTETEEPDDTLVAMARRFSPTPPRSNGNGDQPK
jgi:hypothetical protein